LRRFHILALCALAACHPAPSDPDRPATPSQTRRPEFPGEAMRWRALRWRGEDGTIPDGAWLRAIRQREQVVAAADTLDQGGIAPAAWTERGPFNVAGRSRTILIDPRDPTRIWSGGVSGGLWRSEDRGTTWLPVDDWWTNLSIACISADPADPDVIYVGTGEGFYNDSVLRGVNSSSVRGVGVFRSRDGGQTWSHLGATAAWPYTQRIAVSPSDPNLLLASIRPGGIQRSTDGGQTWAQVEASFASYQVLFDPQDGRRAVAHVVDGSLSNHGIVWSGDGGATWARATTGLGQIGGYDARIELSYAPSRPGTVYASCGTNGGTIWRSTDGGRNWSQRTTVGATGANWFYNCIWVDPTDADLVVVGAFHIWRSTDGGASVQQITNGYIMTVDPHLDVHLLVADPGYDGVSNRRLYVATDGGLHVTDDIRNARPGSGWRDLDDTQRSTQFYGLDMHGGTGTIIAGAQDNGTQRLLAGNSRSNMTFGGDGGRVEIDPSNPNYVYGEYVTLQVFRSTNGGGSARFVYSGNSDAANRNANFVAPLCLDPNDPRRLYGGGDRLWRSDDMRASTVQWRPIKPSVGSFISAVTVAAGDPGLGLVGHNDGRIYLSRNVNAVAPTWSALDDNAGRDPLPDRYVSCLAIDPADHRRIWATFGGFAADNVWTSDDGGTSWRVAVGQAPFLLPDAPVNWIVRHPLDAEVLYLATEVGLFATDDGGAHWSASNEGPANVVVEQLRFAHGSTSTLCAATLGRGLWTTEVRRPGAAIFGAPCAGHGLPPALAVDPQQQARVGRPLRLRCEGALPATAAHLLLGLSNSSWAGGALPTDLGAIGMPGCSLLVGPELAFSAVTDAGGNASWSVPIPDLPGLLGARLYAQALAADPLLNAFGLGTTAGLELTIGW
jgi:photosystem II stability/assembly factor-like uncharacterized protein